MPSPKYRRSSLESTRVKQQKDLNAIPGVLEHKSLQYVGQAQKIECHPWDTGAQVLTARGSSTGINCHIKIMETYVTDMDGYAVAKSGDHIGSISPGEEYAARNYPPWNSRYRR